LGLTDGLPPGVSGGGMTGILSPEGGGDCFIRGSTPAGGVITPPERLSSELLDPLSGRALSWLGWRRSSSAAPAAVMSAKNVVARSHLLSILASVSPLWRPTPQCSATLLVRRCGLGIARRGE